MNIHIAYAITSEDLHEFQRAHRNPRNVQSGRLRGKLAWGLVVVVFVLVFVIFRAPETPTAVPASEPARQGLFLNLTLQVLPWVLFVVLVWYFFFRRFGRGAMKRLIAKNPRIAEPQEVDIADDQITIRTSHSTLILKWTHFTRFFETQSIFLLYTEPAVAHLIPKRAFVSTADADWFRGVVQSHIGNQSHGFPVLSEGPNPNSPRQPPV